jgi:hypothetical protein
MQRIQFDSCMHCVLVREVRKCHVGRYFVLYDNCLVMNVPSSRVGLRGVELHRHRRGVSVVLWRARVQRVRFSQPLEKAWTILLLRRCREP